MLLVLIIVEFAKLNIKNLVTFMTGTPFYATNLDRATLRLCLVATADMGQPGEGVGVVIALSPNLEGALYPRIC